MTLRFATHCLAIVGLAIFLLKPAMAHDVVKHASPSPNETIHPGEVTVAIEYTGRVNASLSRLTLVGPDKRERKLPLTHDLAPNIISAFAGTLEPGLYTLRWQVLSTDGHLSRGDIPFKVAE